MHQYYSHLLCCFYCTLNNLVIRRIPCTHSSFKTPKVQLIVPCIRVNPYYWDDSSISVGTRDLFKFLWHKAKALEKTSTSNPSEVNFHLQERGCINDPCKRSCYTSPDQYLLNQHHIPMWLCHSSGYIRAQVNGRKTLRPELRIASNTFNSQQYSANPTAP